MVQVVADTPVQINHLGVDGQQGSTTGGLNKAYNLGEGSFLGCLCCDDSGW